jgi:nucleoside-diphosphate-sugar epimerase
MNVTSLRIFGIFGPGQTDKLIPSLIESVRQGRQIFTNGNLNDPDDLGGLKVSPIFIDDAVDVLLSLAISSGPPVMNLAGNYTLSVADIVSAIGIGLNLSVDIKPSGKFRFGDLVADTALLEHTIKLRSTPFNTALDKVLAGST